jgi:hypothetical protein
LGTRHGMLTAVHPVIQKRAWRHIDDTSQVLAVVEAAL